MNPNQPSGGSDTQASNRPIGFAFPITGDIPPANPNYNNNSNISESSSSNTPGIEAWTLAPLSPEQQALLDEIELCIEVLNEKIKEVHNRGGDVETINKELATLKQRADEVKNNGYTATSQAVSELAEYAKASSQTMQALNKIKETSRQNTNSEIPHADLKTWREKLTTDVEEFLIKSGVDKSLASSSAPEITKDAINNQTKELNFFQKIVVAINLRIVHRNDSGTWLKSYLKKNIFKDGRTDEATINKYIEKNYSEVHAEMVKKQAAEAKKQELTNAPRIEPTVQPETKQGKAEGVAENLKSEPIQPLAAEGRTKKTEPEAKRSGQLKHFSENIQVKKILEVIGNSADQDPIKKGQASAKEYIDVVLQQYAEIDGIDKFRGITQSATAAIQDHNLFLEDAEIDQIFNTIDAPEALTEDQLQTFEFERELGSGTLKNLIAQKRESYEKIKGFYDAGLQAAGFSNESDLKNIDSAKQEAANKIIERHISEGIIDGIIENQLKSFILLDAAKAAEQKQLYMKLLDAGAIEFRLAEHEGGATPVLITHSTDTIGSQVLLYQLSGGNPQLLPTDPNQRPAGSYTTYSTTGAPLGVMIIADLSEIPSNGQLGELYLEETIRENILHEAIHAKWAAERAAKEAAGAQRVTNIAINGSLGKSLLIELAKTNNPDLFQDENAILNLAREKYPDIGSIQELNKRELREYQLRLIELQSAPDLENYKKIIEAAVTGEQVSEDLQAILDRPESATKKRAFEKWSERYQQIVNHESNKILEEVTAASANFKNEKLYFSLATGKEYDFKNTEHITAAGLIQIINQVDNGESNSYIDKVWLAEYLGTVGDDLGAADAYKIIARIEKAQNLNPEDLATAPADLVKLRSIVDKYFPKWNAPLSGERLAQTLVERAEAITGQADPQASATRYLATRLQTLLDASQQEAITGDTTATQAAREDALALVREYFPDQPELGQIISKLNYKNANWYNLFFKIASQEVTGVVPEGFVENTATAQFVHFSANLRHPARIAVNNFYLGGRKAEDRQGEGYGGKWDILGSYRHPKDLGNPLLQVLGVNAKVRMEGFGIGFKKDELRLDKQDFLEGVGLAVGLPLNRLPALERWLEDKSVDPWKPEGYLLGNVDTYSMGVVRDVIGRLNIDHAYDPQSIARLVLELGGFDYDASGQPIAKRTTYANRYDEYRLNPALAKFINDELVNEYGPTSTRADLAEIAQRMQKDSMWYEGQMVEVTCNNNGDIVTNMNGSEVIIQKGGLTIGQITGNTIKEIEEIMVYYENTKNPVAKPLNHLGRGMNFYLDQFKKPTEKIEMLGKFKEIATAMMVEDAERRKIGKKFTLYELLNEMDKVQGQKMDENLSDDKTHALKKEVSDKYTKPKIQIGGNDFEMLTAKEFFKEFSLARSQKVLTTGVWAQEYKDFDYAKDPTTGQDTNRKQIISSEELLAKRQAAYEAGNYRVDSLDNCQIHYCGDEIYLIIYPRHQGEQVEITKMRSIRKAYSKDAKLTFISKQTGFEFKLDAIRGLPPEKLLYYYGKRSTFNVMTRDKKTGEITEHEVTGRAKYSTEEGVIYDDVYDTLTKTRNGKFWSYSYAVKLMQIDKYREFSKMQKEFWDGMKMLDDNFRRVVVAMSLMSLLVPGLGFLANPVLLLGTIAWGNIVSPFLKRYYEAWEHRQKAATEAQINVMGMKDAFWALANENETPSFGQLDLAASMYETVKYQYKSMLKSMNEGAKWNTNIFTNLTAELYGKVSAKAW